MPHLFKLVIGSLAAFVLLFLAGCGQAVAPVDVEPMAPEPIAVATEVPAPEMEETDETETAVAQPVDECVACHIDKDRIIANLAPEEEVIKESEGVG